jgi:hypothetical protein
VFPLVAFQKSENCSIVFVSSTGLSALSSILVDRLISVDFYANFLTRVVSLHRFEEVTGYILSFPSHTPSTLFSTNSTKLLSTA